MYEEHPDYRDDRYFYIKYLNNELNIKKKKLIFLLRLIIIQIGKDTRAPKEVEKEEGKIVRVNLTVINST